MFGKLRPVGSRVCKIDEAREGIALPWHGHYSATTVSSGTAALSLAILAAIGGRKIKRPEVLLPAYGCPDLVAAVTAQGAVPVLIDLEANSPWMDIKLLDAAVTEQTVALVAVGFLGIPERLRILRDWTQSRHLVLIEDSAQCFPPGSCSGEAIADHVILSMGRGKPLNLMGGGILLSRTELVSSSEILINTLPRVVLHKGVRWIFRAAIYNVMISRVVYGILEKLPFLHIGETGLHSLEHVARLELPRGALQSAIFHREQIRDWTPFYSEALAFLKPEGWMLLPETYAQMLRDQGDNAAGTAVGPVLRYGLLAPDRKTRDLAVTMLNDAGIGANAFYGRILPEIAGVSALLGNPGATFPEAKRFADRLLTLPTHEDVSSKDIERIISVLKRLVLRS